jgi:hypothetical protein
MIIAQNGKDEKDEKDQKDEKEQQRAYWKSL